MTDEPPDGTGTGNRARLYQRGYPGAIRGTAALVLAAGRGARLGHVLPKAFVPLAGRPLLVHALEAMARVPEIDRVVPVIAAEHRHRLASLAAELAAIPKLAPAVEGGAERQDSVAAGLAALPEEIEWVAVHDAARPLVRAEAVSRVLAAARREGAAILAAPVRDTIKRVRGGRVLATPERSECWAAQTPQVFRVEVLREALEKAAAEGFLGSDDAQIVERLGVQITVVEGDADNLKLTLAADWEVAERWLEREERR
jgi:2-C-methyl-D-erythritol 4-phosphate cytidylyltransferase